MRLLVALLLVLLPTLARAQAPAPTRLEGKVLVLYDSSNSMWGQVTAGGREEAKVTAARREVRRLIEQLGTGGIEVELGLMAYGHRRQRDCGDIELLFAPQSLRNPSYRTRLGSTIETIRPTGTTPIAASLEAAAKAARFTEERTTVILVTDGIEECAGDPCAVARELERQAESFTAHVIAFDLNARETAAIRCVADETGGKLYEARNATELPKAIDELAKELAEKEWLRRPGRAVFTLALAGINEPIPPPVPDAAVLIEAGTDGPPRRAPFTGARAVAELSRGSYRAELVLPGLAARRQPFTVEPTRETPVTFTFGPSRLTLTGKVAPSALFPDRPPEPVALELVRLDPAGEVPVATAEGRLVRDDLPPGRYRATARWGGAVRQQEVKLGLEERAVTELPFDPARIAAKVADPKGQVIDDSVLVWRIEPLAPSGAPVELSAARLDATLPPGRYRIVASYGVETSNPEEFTIGSGERADATLRLPILPE